MPISQAKLDETFAAIEAAAVAGERCPMSQPYGPLNAGAVTALCREGKIRVYISQHNWRTVTILVGPNTGKSTKWDGTRIWKVVGKVTTINGREVQGYTKWRPPPLRDLSGGY